MAAAEVYAQQLYRLGHGLSAWEPEHEVQIGDVGFIQDGRFIKLFNATRAENDPCQRLGVPPYFTPLDLPAHLRDDPYKYFDPMVLHTRSVKNVQVDIDSSNASLIPFGAGFRFECCNDLGAVLVLKQKAMRQNLRDSRVVRQYIRDNVDSWYEFANDLGFRVSEGDIFMVRGCDKTSEWAVAAFAERSADAGISFNGGYVVDAGVRVAVTGSWGWFCSAEHRSGPETAKDPAEFDQTVFIRVWKFRRFPFRIPTRISAAAEPRDGFFDGSDGDCSADWGSDGSSPSSEVAIKLDPSTIKAKHPLDFLLHHMFESGTVSFAIATDDDLYSLFNEVPPLNELPSMLNSQNIGVHVDVQGVASIRRVAASSRTENEREQVDAPAVGTLTNAPMTWEPSSSAQETGVQLCSIVLLGAGGVGKTAIVCQYVHEYFSDLYDPTIEDTYIKVTTVDSVPCTVEVVDTAGQSEYMPITEQWIKLGQAFILVYDITSRASFEQLRIFRGYMLKHRRSLPSCMLVGNKCERALQREVPTEEGQEMAQSFGCPFVEVSAKTAWGVPTLFENFVRILRLKPVDERSSTSRRLSRSFRSRKSGCVLM